jgi:hypothetical protein
MDVEQGAESADSDAVVLNNVIVTGRQDQTLANRQFVNSCIYLASYEADKRHDSDRQPGEWFDRFVGTFWSAGWTLEDEPVDIVTPQFSGSVQRAWKESAGRLLTHSQTLQVDAAMASVEKDALLLNKFVSLEGRIYKSHVVPMRSDSLGGLEIVVNQIRLFKSVFSPTYLFWHVHQPTSQLDLRARKLVIKRRDIDASQAVVEKAIRAIPYKLEEYPI